MLVSLTAYLFPNFYFSLIARPQNLRQKYGDWAIVTGASSGIGRAIAKKLASQGVNVVLVALADKALEDAHAELNQKYPGVKLRAVGADLSKDHDRYMSDIRGATDDVRITMVFSNAGYLLMGFFEKRDIDAHVANIECNAIAGVRIAHHFYNRMIEDGNKGCIAFTSSAVCFMVRTFTAILSVHIAFALKFSLLLREEVAHDLKVLRWLTSLTFDLCNLCAINLVAKPAPFATMYGSSKALLTQFAPSLAIEAEQHGIDVTCVHPSYTHSNLYAKTPKLDVISFLQKFGWTPDSVADAVFACVGRTYVRDLGTYAIATNLISRLVDQNSLAAAIVPFRDSMGPKTA